MQLASIGVQNEYLKRRELREMLFRSEGIENYIRCYRGDSCKYIILMAAGRNHSPPFAGWPQLAVAIGKYCRLCCGRG